MWLDRLRLDNGWSFYLPFLFLWHFMASVRNIVKMVMPAKNMPICPISVCGLVT